MLGKVVPCSSVLGSRCAKTDGAMNGALVGASDGTSDGASDVASNGGASGAPNRATAVSNRAAERYKKNYALTIIAVWNRHLRLRVLCYFFLFKFLRRSFC